MNMTVANILNFKPADDTATRLAALDALSGNIMIADPGRNIT